MMRMTIAGGIEEIREGRLMRRVTNRKSAFVGSATVALVFAGALIAWACTNLATVSPDKPAAEPDDTLTITGQSFAPVQGQGHSGTSASPVAIRFNSLEGQVLGTATPNAAGDFTATIRVPKVDPGQYVLVATQTQEGGPAFGTPARVAITVLGPGGQPAPAQAAPVGRAPISIAPVAKNSSVGLVLLAVIGVLAVALLAGGAAAFVAEARRREVGAKVAAEK
jgi:hypothetical protein